MILPIGGVFLIVDFMKNFEFKSQICTSRSQSEKLLALGLKKETADITWFRRSKNTNWECCVSPYTEWIEEILPIVDVYTLEDIIPAWSLHRLIEIIQNNEKEISYILDREELTIEWFDDGGWKNKFFRHIENNIYDSMISCIEYMLKEGLINPEYLEKQA
jgi:hypothetical protein